MRQTLSNRLGVAAEPIIEWTIRLCGWSAIFFVFAIFFFVFREGAPFLFGKLDIVEFLTNVNWRPDSRIKAQYGVLALITGTARSPRSPPSSRCRRVLARRSSCPSSARAGCARC
jgi:ABC-type phosphate transport system permease subunit